jgi:hypothetical protein
LGKTPRRQEENTYSGKSVLRLELLGSLQIVVDQSKTSGASTTENSAETEEEDGVQLADLEQLLLLQSTNGYKRKAT